ncbi:hypothetical protein BRADI_2g17606v3 [Brachypodium distachyon]|uniref:Uncharacterized protein n=1 Tax=Brachypodium distachyon TaxID=15368 RepID=A0A0Q3IX55_BRADI|nr:hypothetical protein BRADI_2g17606v3 [Brachypodium distachyon]
MDELAHSSLPPFSHSLTPVASSLAPTASAPRRSPWTCGGAVRFEAHARTPRRGGGPRAPIPRSAASATTGAPVPWGPPAATSGSALTSRHPARAASRPARPAPRQRTSHGKKTMRPGRPVHGIASAHPPPSFPGHDNARSGLPGRYPAGSGFPRP